MYDTVYHYSSAPQPQFEEMEYTVHENDRSSVMLCIDVGVILSGPMEYTVTAMQKDPPAAQGVVRENA